MHRWRLRGVHGIRLESVVVGGRRMTSHEAIERFIERTTAAVDSDGISPDGPNTCRRAQSNRPRPRWPRPVSNEKGHPRSNGGLFLVSEVSSIQRTDRMNSNNGRDRRQRERILLVTHSDGWLEVFAGPGVLVHHATMLATTPAGEVKAEAVLEEQLPRSYRELYEPGNRRYAGLARPRTRPMNSRGNPTWPCSTHSSSLGSALRTEEASAWVV